MFLLKNMRSHLSHQKLKDDLSFPQHKTHQASLRLATCTGVTVGCGSNPSVLRKTHGTHISPVGKKGKSWTQKCLCRGYVIVSRMVFVKTWIIYRSRGAHILVNYHLYIIISQKSPETGKCRKFLHNESI